MRITFFILVLANLVLLLWHTQISSSWNKASKLSPTIPAEKRLIMLSEFQLAQRAKNPELTAPVNESKPVLAVKLPDIEIIGAVTSSVAEPELQKPANVCFTLGPFKEQPEVDEASKRLGKINAEFHQRSKIEQEQYGYRVYLKSFSTREEAISESRKLSDKGIRDYYIISDDSDHKNGISLGLFRKKTGAVRRMAQIRRFDFKPQMEIRYRDTTIYWLDYEHDTEIDSKDLWRELVESEPGLQRLVRDC